MTKRMLQSDRYPLMRGCGFGLHIFLSLGFWAICFVIQGIGYFPVVRCFLSCFKPNLLWWSWQIIVRFHNIHLERFFGFVMASINVFYLGGMCCLRWFSMWISCTFYANFILFGAETKWNRNSFLKRGCTAQL